jgi:DNA-binding transcriptional regulator YiaG
MEGAKEGEQKPPRNVATMTEIVAFNMYTSTEPRILLPDPAPIVAVAMHELIQATGLSDQEIANYINEARRTSNVTAGMVRAWAKGMAMPNATHALVILWLAGSQGRQIVHECLQTPGRLAS